MARSKAQIAGEFLITLKEHRILLVDVDDHEPLSDDEKIALMQSVMDNDQHLAALVDEFKTK